MLHRFVSPTVSAVALACAVGAASPASADIIPFASSGGLEGLGAYSGTIEYDEVTFQLTITITNDSNPLNGGYITGFVFNIASGDANATATLTSWTHPFVGVTNESAAPFGTFDAGAALGGDWLGGGSPHAGIAVGDTGTFVFDVSASDAGSLTAESFVGGIGSAEFVIRFKGFEDGGSDKVPGFFDESLIPGPSVLALLAIGIAGWRRRRR